MLGTIMKLLRGLKTIRLDDSSPLRGDELNMVLLSSPYAAQQSAFLNSYRTGISKTEINYMLKEYWGVSDRESAMALVNYLFASMNDDNMKVVFTAFVEDNPQYLRDNLDFSDKDGNVDEESRDRYISYFRHLPEIVHEVVSSGLFIKDKSEIETCNQMAWSVGRLAYLLRCFHDMGYISMQEMKDCLVPLWEMFNDTFTSWRQYAASYIIGRGLWSGSSQQGMISVVEDLFTKQESPLYNAE